ncbi:unnamed protein product [Lymnaea stagnalis]|uniref:VWFD domain-containing protein n=1 Tax=Lymnaea stagnalis TaxID=6523 RepID=A0AAV2HMY4_LYMST
MRVDALLFRDFLSYATAVEVRVGTLLTIVYDVTPGKPRVAYYKLSSSPKVDLRPGDQVVKAYDVKYTITLDRSDNSLLVNAPLCSLNVLFRPPPGSGAVAEQTKTPGVAITVKRDCIVPNSLLGYPAALCAKPSCTDKGLGVYQRENRLDTGELAALLAWLKSKTKQTGGSQCAAAMETFNNVCNTRALSTQAVNACGPIFSSHIIKCVAKRFDIVELFTRCITAICSQDQGKCSKLDNEVKQAKCSVPTLTARCRTIT